MTNRIQSIPLAQLVPHPDNPNRMSRANFAKLLRNIERTGRYEPLIVRPITQKDISHEDTRLGEGTSRSRTKSQRNQLYKEETSCLGAFVAKTDCFQIINGYHRWLALKELGKKSADAIVWDIDDAQTDILLATLNRLCGQDVLDKKLTLLKRLSEKMQSSELAKLLPQTKKQLEKLIELDSQRLSFVRRNFSEGGSFANPMMFFINDEQQQIIEHALSLPTATQKQKTKAAKRASALSAICQYYLDNNNDQRVTKDD